MEIAAGNVLDLFAMFDPSKMVEKLKLHLLAHLRADIIRFGPLVGVATEAFECFNAIFRFCSIHSNHLAPSRDISNQLAGQEGLKHRITGGWWPLSSGDWVQAGLAVRESLYSQPMLQGLLGWQNPKTLIRGKLRSSALAPSDADIILFTRFLHTLRYAENREKAILQVINPCIHEGFACNQLQVI